MKKILQLVTTLIIAITLCACSQNKWIGTYGGTTSNGSKVEITIKKGGTAIYKEYDHEYEGTWSENENSITLDFNGEVSDECEPLIVTMSSDGNEITVDSYSKRWTPDIYQRR